MYEKEKLIIDAVIPANNLHVRTELNYKKLSLKLKDFTDFRLPFLVAL